LVIFSFVGLIVGYFYFHEFGHALWGSFGSILCGEIPSAPYFSRWKDFLGIPVPLQTKFEHGIDTPFGSYGGPLHSIIYPVLILLILFKLTPPKKDKITNVMFFSILFVSVFTTYTILGDVFFGTDNHYRTPIFAYENHPLIDVFLTYSFFLIFILWLFIVYLFGYERISVGGFLETMRRIY